MGRREHPGVESAWQHWQEIQARLKSLSSGGFSDEQIAATLLLEYNVNISPDEVQHFL
jgi:hypothetical protein